MERHIRFLLFVLFLLPLPVHAASCSSKPQTFDMATFPLAVALQRFEKQTRCRIYVDPVLLEGRKTYALVGRYSPAKALRVLIGPTGLEAVRGMEGFMLHPVGYEPSQHRQTPE